MLMLVSMTLTLMQGHSGSAKAKKNRFCMLLATKQAMSIELATMVGHSRYVTLTLHIYINGLTNLLVFA